MKLLLTADLDFRIDWFQGLIGQAPNYDLVCIAGDLLDMLDVKSTREQAREVTSLIRELADIVPVAVCSGNHDNAGGLVSHDRASLYKWLVDLGAHPNIVTDGVTLRAHPLVEALNDGVTPELLKRISAEIVLTADDIELALDAQERVAAESS